MRTCAICGASLPESLRHGAMYCPHGRCKTKAYRSRKKEAGQRDAAQKQAAAVLTAPAEPPSPGLPKEGLGQACTSLAGTPLMFSHALACACGQQFTVHILISHDRAIDQSPTKTSAPSTASQAILETAGAPQAQPVMSPSSPIEAGAEVPKDSWAPTLELGGSTVQTASAELHSVAPESSVAAAAEPILAPESPAEILHAGAAKENRTDPAIAISRIESEGDRPETLAQALPESSAEDVARSSELQAVGSSPAPSESGPSTHAPPSAAPPAAGPVGGRFWQQVKENPTQAMGVFYRLLELGYSTNDQALVERAHSGLALVYALRGDGPHAVEQLDRARMAAMKRGDTAEVRVVAEMVDKLLSASHPRASERMIRG